MHFFTLPPESEIKNTATESRALMQKVYTSNDHEIPKSVDFDAICSRIFCITEDGLFSCWKFANLELQYQIAFRMVTTSMIVLKSVPYVILAFDKELKVLDVSDPRRAVEIPSFAQKFDLTTSYTNVSFNEKYLSVAMSLNSEKNTAIEVYKIELEGAVRRFTHLVKVENVNSSVQFIDFSSDNKYMMYMGYNTHEKDNKGFYDLIEKKSKLYNTDKELEKVVWVGEGFKIGNKIAVRAAHPGHERVLRRGQQDHLSRAADRQDHHRRRPDRHGRPR